MSSFGNQNCMLKLSSPSFVYNVELIILIHLPTVTAVQPSGQICHGYHLKQNTRYHTLRAAFSKNRFNGERHSWFHDRLNVILYGSEEEVLAYLCVVSLEACETVYQFHALKNLILQKSLCY